MPRMINDKCNNCGECIRYATKGVFDSNTTANIIMEYKGK